MWNQQQAMPEEIGMFEGQNSPYMALERVFHEPNRLAIMSALGGAVDGLRFVDLKKQCTLTDGNLSRHLKTLEEANAIRVEKRYVGGRPQTTLFITGAGREGFMQYLRALEEVLMKASESLGAEQVGLSFFADGVDAANA